MMRKIFIFSVIFGLFAIWTGVSWGGEELIFESQAGAPVPEIGVVAATNSTVWDLVSLGIDEIGVRFKADDVLPSSAVIRWRGGSHYYFQRLDLEGAVVGEWVDCSFSVEGLKAGGWGGGGRSEDDFLQDLHRFQEVEVQVCRRGMAAQRYEVEGFYLAKDGVLSDGEPLPGEVHLVEAQAEEDGGVKMWWGSLQRGVTYEKQHSDELEDRRWVWVSDGTLTSETHEALWVDDGGPGPVRLYRLKVLDE